MIESLTIAGPIALLRSFALSPAADLPRPERADPFVDLDPNAPVGPRPTFAVTPMERLLEDQRAFGGRVYETGLSKEAAQVFSEDAAGLSQVGPSDAAGSFPGPADGRNLDRRA